MSKAKPFLTLEEVAEMMGVNYHLIYRLARSGELPSYRVGKLYRVSQEDLDLFLQKNRQARSEYPCAACGKVYQSRLSVPHQCEETGQPICVDCWTRKKIRKVGGAKDEGRGGKGGKKS
jgi:excisionase family DNA binding protein